MSCKALALYSEKSLHYTVLMRRKHQKKVLQYIFGEVKEDERGERELPSGNDRSRMRSLTQQSAKRNEKKSSLISLRKDNEVKLEDEIKKSVTSIR